MTDMTVRAKFKCIGYDTREGTRDSGRKNENGQPIYEAVEIRTVLLQPVYSSDPSSENRRFWQASPTGKIELGTINPEAWQHFEMGKEYYVDFTPADA